MIRTVILSILVLAALALFLLQTSITSENIGTYNAKPNDTAGAEALAEADLPSQEHAPTVRAILRNPFEPVSEIPTPALAPNVALPVDLKVIGVVTARGLKAALLVSTEFSEPKSVIAGSTINGWRITSIDRKGLEMTSAELGGQVRRLDLDPDR